MMLYAKLAGRAGGQTLIGTTTTGGLFLQGDATDDMVRIGHTSRTSLISSSPFQTITASYNSVVISPDPITIGANSLTVRTYVAHGEYNNTGRTGTNVAGFRFFQQLNAGTFASAVGVQVVLDPVGSAIFSTELIGLEIARDASYSVGAASADAKGIEIEDVGHVNFTTVTALDILSQTAGGTSTYNIRQRGTTGVNRLAAPTLIGADSSPDAGVTLQVVGAIQIDSIAGVAQSLRFRNPADSAQTTIAAGAQVADIAYILPTTQGAATSFLKNDGAGALSWSVDPVETTDASWIDLTDGGATTLHTHAVVAHETLSATHTDTLAATVVDGDVVIGNVTPKWSRLAIAIPAVNIRNVLGVDNGELRPSWKTALDATNPVDIASVASSGTSLVFSHRDHVHAHPVFGSGDLHTEYMTPAEHTA